MRLCRTPHGASRLVQAMPAWLVKTRRAPSRHSRDARVHGLTTRAMHKLSTPPHYSIVLVCNFGCNNREEIAELLDTTSTDTLYDFPPAFIKSNTCGYQALLPRSYRLVITIILEDHPGSSWGTLRGFLVVDPRECGYAHTPPRCVC